MNIYLSWDSITNNKYRSLNDVIDKNSNYIKNQYLFLLEKINDLNINNISLKENFNYKKKHNFFDYSLINERSFYKSKNIDHCLKLIALEKIFLENPEANIHVICKDQSIISNLKLINKYKNFEFIFDKNNLFKSNYWAQIIEKINLQNIKVNYLHIENNPLSSKEKIQNKFLLNKIRLNSYNSHNILYSYLTFFSIIFSFILYIKFSLKFYRFKRLKKNFDKNSFLYVFADFIENDWITSINGYVLFENLLFISAFSNFFNQSRVNNIFFLFENQTWEKIMRKCSNNSNINFYAFIHSTIRYWDLRYTSKINNFNNYILVTGSPAEKMLIEYGYEGKKLIKVESLRYQKYLFINTKKKFINKILIIGDYIDEINYSLLNLISKINKNSLNQYNFIFKNHPNKNIDLSDYSDCIEKYESNIIDRNEYLLIICCYPTSAVIDYMLLNQKFLIYYDNNSVNTSPLYNIEKFSHFTNKNELISFLKEIDDIKKISISRNFLFLNKDYKLWNNFLNKKIL